MVFFNKKQVTKIFVIGFVLLPLTLLTFYTLSTKASPTTHIKQSLLTELDNFEYIGAFRFPVNIFGSSRLSYINGNFTINEQTNSIFIAGHQHHQAIAEFSIPVLKQEFKPASLNLSKNLQVFIPFLKNKSRIKNPQGLNRITGMEIIEGELFVNAAQYYDAPGDNSYSTLIFRDSSDLKNSKIDGLFTLKGLMHSAGWLSKLSGKWRDIFGASYLHGYAGNIPINSRLSMGPSAFVSNIDAFAGIDEHDGLIPTRALMDFSIRNPMMKDLYNKSGNNNMWTELSSAYYGFIVPNTDYYLVLGTSGGHESGIGYKAIQINGNQCGGPCAIDPSDYYNFYWIFDVNDFLDVKNKKRKPWELSPKHFGKLQLPFSPKNMRKSLISADFDNKNNILYILLENIDRSQSSYEIAPVMLAYKLRATNQDG